MSKLAILIPAYRPSKKMLSLVINLISTGIPVVVVDDGGGDEYSGIFGEAQREGCTVLHHVKNKGKGRALKTGIEHLVKNGYSGFITADADGQHSCNDIKRITKKLEENPRCLILGVRDLSQMPIKSKIGNTLTRWIFSVMYGMKTTDTQTGLRGIPLLLDNITKLLDLEGERYEYETNILLSANNLFDGLREINIETIYFNKNALSHFRPIQDGMRIYALLFKHFPKFLLSSLLAFLIDYFLFTLFFYIFGMGTVLCNVLARIISATINYCVNKNIVFKNSGNKYTALKYFFLAAAILLLNSSLIFLLIDILHVPAFIGKMFVEIILYFISFFMQNKFAHRK